MAASLPADGLRDKVDFPFFAFLLLGTKPLFLSAQAPEPANPDDDTRQSPFFLYEVVAE